MALRTGVLTGLRNAGTRSAGLRKTVTSLPRRSFFWSTSPAAAAAAPGAAAVGDAAAGTADAASALAAAFAPVAAAAAAAAPPAVAPSSSLLSMAAAALSPPPSAASAAAATDAAAVRLQQLEAAFPHNGRFPDFSLVESTMQQGGYWGRAMEAVVYCHSEAGLGLEWGAAIAACSLVLRVATMPFFFKATLTGAWMQHHHEAIAAFSEQLQHAQRLKDQEGMRRTLLERRAFMAKHGLLMRYVMLPALVQLPVFVTFFSTLRQLAREAHLEPLQGLAASGAAAGALGGGGSGGGSLVFWVSALHLPDPLFVIPVASAALSAAAIAVNRNLQGVPQLDLTPGGQKLLFGSLGVAFNLATVFLPATVQIYIGVTSATMLLQQLLLRSAPLRTSLGFPADWPIAPEVFAERQRKRTEALGGAPTANPMVEGMRGLQPLFRRASALARGELRAEPSHAYVTIFGLRDPGLPGPPDSPPPSAALVAAVARGAALSAPLPAGLAPTSASSSSASPSDSAVSQQRPLPIVSGRPTLLANRPPKKKAALK